MPLNNLIATEIFVSLFSATLIGGIIGLEREKTKISNNQSTINPIGIRTNILISLFGAISVLLSQLFHPAIFYISLISIIAFLMIPFIYLVLNKKRINFKTELSSIIVFILGAMAMLIDDPLIPIIIGIIVTLALSMKKFLHTTVEKVSYGEIIDSIKFVIIAFVILPFLPNQSFDAQVIQFFTEIEQIDNGFLELNIINPYRIWLIVVIISAIIFLGYVLVRMVGKNKGISLTGLIGGLYSSTATSLTLSKQSKFYDHIKNPYLSGISLACGSSFLKLFIIIQALNRDLFFRSAPAMLAMCIYLLLTGYLIMRLSKRREDKIEIQVANFDQKVQSPFQLGQAIQFALILTAVLILSIVILAFAELNWYYILAGLMSLLSISDPIIISTAELAGSALSLDLAKNIVISAIFLNMIQKIGTVYIFGNRKLLPKLSLIFGGLLLVTGVGLIYL